VRKPTAVFRVDFSAVHLDRKAIWLAITEIFISLWPLNHVMFVPRSLFQRECVRVALRALRVWRVGLRVRLTRFVNGLSATAIFGAREWQEIAEVGSIKDDPGMEAPCLGATSDTATTEIMQSFSTVTAAALTRR